MGGRLSVRRGDRWDVRRGGRRGIRWGGVLRGVLGAGVLGVVSSRYQAEH